MAYSKHTPRSRRYKRSESHSKEHKPDSDIKSQDNMESIPLLEAPEQAERKSSHASGFLSSIFGSGDRDHSGSPIFNVFGQDIYLDDLLLVGLIILLMTDKIDDEILLIILVYLLLDIF